MNEQQTYTLWHRPNRKHQWQAIASAPTEAELTGLICTLPSGEVMTLRRMICLLCDQPMTPGTRARQWQCPACGTRMTLPKLGAGA